MGSGVTASPTIAKWFPLAVSLDLAKGPAVSVADAVCSQVQRFVKSEPILRQESRFPSLDEVFNSVREFSNAPTQFFVLPTKTEWTVLWNNSYLCDGYDSLCYCLTHRHGLPTIHWAASDVDHVFQAGSQFIFRRRDGDLIWERSVTCIREDERWTFYQTGTPLPEEDTSWYKERPTKNRLNESKVMTLLARMGARPWQEDFYDFTRPVVVLRRKSFPQTIDVREFAYVRHRASPNSDNRS